MRFLCHPFTYSLMHICDGASSHIVAEIRHNMCRFYATLVNMRIDIG